MGEIKVKQQSLEKVLGSGRKVTIGPLRWVAFEPLIAEVFKIYVARLKDLGNAGHGPQFMVSAVYAMLGEPQRWMHVASTTIASWITWGSIYKDGDKDYTDGKILPPVLEDSRPDMRSWSAEDVAEVMEVSASLTDFPVISARLKNSLGPVADDIAGLSMTGRGDSKTNAVGEDVVETKD